MLLDLRLFVSRINRMNSAYCQKNVVCGAVAVGGWTPVPMIAGPSGFSRFRLGSSERPRIFQVSYLVT